MPRLLIVVAACLFATSCGETATEQPSVEPQTEQSTPDPAMATTRELPPGRPEEVGMSADGLKKIDDVVQEYVDAGRIQGAVVGVTRRNKVVYLEAHVSLTRRPGLPCVRTRCSTWSPRPSRCSGVAAMMVMEESLISPEDPVEKYIPEFKGIQVAVASASADKDISQRKSGKNRRSPTISLWMQNGP